MWITQLVSQLQENEITQQLVSQTTDSARQGDAVAIAAPAIGELIPAIF